MVSRCCSSMSLGLVVILIDRRCGDHRCGLSLLWLSSLWLIVIAFDYSGGWSSGWLVVVVVGCHFVWVVVGEFVFVVLVVTVAVVLLVVLFLVVMVVKVSREKKRKKSTINVSGVRKLFLCATALKAYFLCFKV